MNFFKFTFATTRASLLTGRYHLETRVRYLGSEKIDIDADPPFSVSIVSGQSGQHTFNVEFKSRSGIANMVHGDIMVLDK